MKKRLLCFVLALALALPLAALAAEKPAEADPSWSAAFARFILDGGYRTETRSWSSAPSFALHDMDGDGVPELIACSNAADAGDKTADVYTAFYDELRYAGSAGFCGPADRYASGSGYPGLYCLGDRGELSRGIYYTLKNNTVTAEPVLTVTADGDSVTVIQETRDTDLFTLFAPKDVDAIRTAPGTVLTFRTAEEIRAMGWDKFVSASLQADNTLFRDVSLNHWAWTYIDYVCREDLMTGTGYGYFTPSALINQAQVLTILYRLEGQPSVSGSTAFPDLPDSAWYAPAARWAAGVGIISDQPAALRPDGAVERQELIRMLYCYAQYKKISTPATVAIFSDWDQVREDCVEAMYWSVGAGLITGSGDGRLDPTGSLTRAQLAAMLFRFCENVLR